MTARFKGRNEIDYIGELAALEATFVTADREFVNRVLEAKTHHGGIVLLPTGWDSDTLAFALAGMAGFLKGAVERDGRRSLYDKVYYIADDGYHEVIKGKDKLFYSVGRLEIDI